MGSCMSASRCDTLGEVPSSAAAESGTSRFLVQDAAEIKFAEIKQRADLGLSVTSRRGIPPLRPDRHCEDHTVANGLSSFWE